MPLIAYYPSFEKEVLVRRVLTEPAQLAECVTPTVVVRGVHHATSERVWHLHPGSPRPPVPPLVLGSGTAPALTGEVTSQFHRLHPPTKKPGRVLGGPREAESDKRKSAGTSQASLSAPSARSSLDEQLHVGSRARLGRRGVRGNVGSCSSPATQSLVPLRARSRGGSSASEMNAGGLHMPPITGAELPS